MFTMHVPKYLWGEVLTASYLMNRMSSRFLNYQTPILSLMKSYPHFRFIHSLPSKSLVLQHLLIIIHLTNVSLNLKPLNVSFLVILPLKRVRNVVV